MTPREKQLERALSLVLDTLEDERKCAAVMGRDSAIVSALSKYVRTIIEIGAAR
jgi:DNA-binding FrmR family transcriptional regulator